MEVQIRNEADIIREVLGGNKAAYAELVSPNHSGLIRLCLARLGDRAQAEEAAQEVFFKAFQALPTFRQGSSFKTWIYRIAVNYCSSLTRKEKGWFFWRKQELDENKNFFPDSHGAADSPLSDDLQKALSILPDQYREILVLRELEEMPYEELSQVLGCSLDAVKSRLKRARNKLEENLRVLKKEDV